MHLVCDDKVKKLFCDMVRKRNRKVWGKFHPLDLDFDAPAENEELKNLRKDKKEESFAAALEEISMAIEREIFQESVQGEGKKRKEDVVASLSTLFGCLDKHDIQRTKRRPFLLEEDFCQIGEVGDIFDHVEVINANLKKVPPADDEICPSFVGRDVGWLRSRLEKHMDLHPDQEMVLAIIVEYVTLEAVCDASTTPVAPLIAVHAGPGCGKSALARELHHRLAPVFGFRVVRFMAPSGIAASNLRGGSTCHHGVGLSVFSETSGQEGFHGESDNKDLIHRLRQEFKGCKVLVIDEMSMIFKTVQIFSFFSSF
jgi:hypothetical protein